MNIVVLCFGVLYSQANEIDDLNELASGLIQGFMRTGDKANSCKVTYYDGNYGELIDKVNLIFTDVSNVLEYQGSAIVSLRIHIVDLLNSMKPNVTNCDFAGFMERAEPKIKELSPYAVLANLFTHQTTVKIDVDRMRNCEKNLKECGFALGNIARTAFGL